MPTKKKTSNVFKALYVVIFTVGYTIVAIFETTRSFFQAMRRMKPIEAQRRYVKKKGSY